MDLKEIGIDERNWVDSAQDRDYWSGLVNAALNLWVPYAITTNYNNIYSQVKINKCDPINRTIRRKLNKK